MIDLSGLNKEQQEAVTTTEGYVRVIAGAGSGKTRALTHRYAYIVENLGVSTRNILCVTFTNKAAAEMKKRIRAMIGDQDLGFICTFHGFCVQFLREENKFLHYPKSFTILDEEDQKSILKNVYKTYNIDTKRYTFQKSLEKISDYKVHSDYVSKYMVDISLDGLLQDIEQTTDEEIKIVLG